MLAYSKDWAQYLRLYEGVGTKWWERHTPDLWIFTEPLYYESSKFMGDLIGYPLFTVLSIIVLLAVKLRYLEKITGILLGGTFFYTCLYLLLFEGTAIRVAFATSLVIPALYYLKQEKPVVSLLLIMLASQIHFSTLIFLVAFPIYYCRKLTPLAFILMAIAPLFVIFDWSVFSWIKEILGAVNPRYLRYGGSKVVDQNSTGLYFYFIAFFTLALGIIHYYLKSDFAKDDFLRTLLTLCILAIVVMCIFHANVAMAARLGELLLVPIVILLALLGMHFIQNGMRWQWSAMMSVFLLFFAARFHYLYPQVLRSFLH